MTDSLGIDDNVMSLALLTVIDDTVYKSLLVIVVTLRKKDILRSVGNTA